MGTVVVDIICYPCVIEDRCFCILECYLRLNGIKENELFSTDRKLFFNVPYNFPFFFEFSSSFRVLVYVYTVSQTLLFWCLNFIDTYYTIIRFPE